MDTVVALGQLADDGGQREEALVDMATLLQSESLCAGVANTFRASIT